MRTDISADWRRWNANTWKTWDAETLERQVSPSTMLLNRDTSPFIERYRREGEAVLADPALRARVLSYGEHPDEVISVVPANVDGPAPLFVFIHGGYWRALSHVDGLFAAPSFAATGCHYASINYTLAPDATLEQIVAQCAKALIWLKHESVHDRLPLEIDWTRVILCGHSAGAHLAALLHPLLRSARLLLIGGVFDVEPLLTTAVNGPLCLEPARAAALSPLRQRTLAASSLFLTGENETDHFKFQSHAYALRRSYAGDDVAEIEVPETNHFDVIFELADATSETRSWVSSQFERRTPD